MDVNCVVANNLKNLRESMKLSLDSVSRLTGVSKSMLGQIERGEVNPTISVLWKIANGLKTSFTALLELPEGDTTVLRGTDVVPFMEDGGRFVNHPVFQFDENKRFETFRIEMAPGGYQEALPHLTGTEEYITVFCGAVRIDVNGEEHVLERGDSIRFKGDVPHSYTNIGAEPVEMSMVIHYSK